jgi:ATP-dependent RNA helicase DDX27
MYNATLACYRILTEQEAVLRQRPDVIVCTPGRLLDHIRNSQSVSLDELDVSVLAFALLPLG